MNNCSGVNVKPQHTQTHMGTHSCTHTGVERYPQFRKSSISSNTFLSFSPPQRTVPGSYPLYQACWYSVSPCDFLMWKLNVGSFRFSSFSKLSPCLLPFFSASPTDAHMYTISLFLFPFIDIQHLWTLFGYLTLCLMPGLQRWKRYTPWLPGIHLQLGETVTIQLEKHLPLYVAHARCWVNLGFILCFLPPPLLLPAPTWSSMGKVNFNLNPSLKYWTWLFS